MSLSTENCSKSAQLSKGMVGKLISQILVIFAELQKDTDGRRQGILMNIALSLVTLFLINLVFI